MWVGTGESWTRNSVSVGNGVYRSTDGGESWQYLGLPNSERIAKILVHPNDSNTAYVCVPGKLWSDSADRGLYKTTDGGASWQHILKGVNLSTGCSGISFDPSNAERLMVGTWDFRRRGWTFRSGGEGPESRSGSALYVTEDGGKNFRALTADNAPGLPKGPWGRIEVEYAPSDASGKLVLERCAIEPLERGWITDGNVEKFDEVAEAVRRVVRKSGTRTKNVALALPPSAVITKKIILPGGEQGLVVVVLQQRRDAPFGELVDAGVALLHADLEALERLHIADAADRGMAVDVDRQPGVGRREIVERLARRRAVDHVDHVGFALLELALRLGPLHRAEPDRDPGLLLPQLPVVDQVALDLAVGVAEQVGRVVVVADDMQGVRVGQGIGGRQQQAGPAQAEREQAPTTDIR